MAGVFFLARFLTGLPLKSLNQRYPGVFYWIEEQGQSEPDYDSVNEMRIFCPVCSISIVLAKVHIGNNGRCDSCNSKFTIPESADSDIEIHERGEIPAKDDKSLYKPREIKNDQPDQPTETKHRSFRLSKGWNSDDGFTLFFDKGLTAWGFFYRIVQAVICFLILASYMVAAGMTPKRPSYPPLSKEVMELLEYNNP